MFLYPALLAGFAFVAVPLLVHLINRLRHQRQSWAAMDFLLASYRKQKNWILLKQLLLLLTRTAIAAILVALLAGWVAGGKLLDLVSTQTTHHLFVLDDSYSMGDGSGAQTAYARGLDALRVLVDQLAVTDGNHQLTVIRASRAALVTLAGSDSADAAADLSARSVLGDASIINRLLATEASQLRTDLAPALDLASRLLPATPADERLVYVASDFRQIDWQNAPRVSAAIGELAQANGQIRLIDCASEPRTNLAITELTPLPDVWVAGVPVTLRVTVKNWGESTATNVAVATNVIRYPASLAQLDPSQRVSGEIETLPALLFEEIASGAELSKTFQVYLTEPGRHAVEAILPDDALAADNRRTCILPLTDLERVLVIDAAPAGQAAFAVRSVLDPGGQVRTGALPDVQNPAVLQSLTAEQLRQYRAIYLIDLPEVTPAVAQRLSDYVQDGGGLFWFLGQQVQRDSYNRVLFEQTRLLPAPLSELAAAPPPQPAATGTATGGDVLLGPPHPLTAPLATIGDHAFALVSSHQAWTLQPSTTTTAAADGADSADSAGAAGGASSQPRPTAGDASAAAAVAVASPPQTVLQRRDGTPWVVEHSLGQGRVITALTALDRDWTNWASDPTFVVFLLQANAHLWSAAAAETSTPLVAGIDFPLPEQDYLGHVTYLSPLPAPPRVPVQWTGNSSASAPPSAIAAPSPAPADGRHPGLPQQQPAIKISPRDEIIQGGGDLDALLVAGIAELQLTQVDGQTRVIPQALVMDVGESDLRRAAAEEVRRAAEPVDVRFVTAGELAGQYDGNRSSATSLVLLTLLVLLLAAEQLLGYSASYHRQSLGEAIRRSLPSWITAAATADPRSPAGAASPADAASPAGGAVHAGAALADSAAIETAGRRQAIRRRQR